MNKNKIILSTLLATSLFARESDEIVKIKKELSQLNKKVTTLERKNTQLKNSCNSKSDGNLKFGADYRLSVDKLNYTMADGSELENRSLFRNRLWLNMHYSFDDHVKFGAQLSYNKFFGQRTSASSLGMDGFDWLATESVQDDVVRVRAVYLNFHYDTFFGMNLPWKLGIGRRPSSNGKLISLREDDPETSPLGHISNAEFDGGSLKFYLDSVLGTTGGSIKFAAGRGMSSVESHFSSAPYSDSSANPTDTITMFAINLIPYSTDTINTEIQYTQADNLVDMTNAGFDMQGNFNPSAYNPALEVVGDLRLISAYGSYRSKSLNDALFFASIAMSQTDPDAKHAMLGSSDSETGQSLWLGAQFASLISQKGKMGFEYNYGSKYWRSFTYGEDTLIGSKIAARGNAIEMYFTEPIVKGLSAQLRYTYIDYDYSGSNGFFGAQSGTPVKISDIPNTTAIAQNVVDKAQDIRLYLRYRF
jgi:hypothetical protein